MSSSTNNMVFTVFSLVPFSCGYVRLAYRGLGWIGTGPQPGRLGRHRQNLRRRDLADNLAAPNVNDADDQAAGRPIYQERQLSLRSERTGLVDGRDGPHQRASFGEQFSTDSRIDRGSLDGLAGNVGNSDIDRKSTRLNSSH